MTDTKRSPHPTLLNREATSGLAPYRTIAIVGVGLIGGSIGLAIKRRFRASTVIGVDKRRVLQAALKRGVIDIAVSDVRAAVKKADLVVLATPLTSTLSLLPTIAAIVPATTCVTDVASIKDAVLQTAKGLFPQRNFIGGHPMTGSELSGVQAANPLLFENAIYVLTPLKRTKKKNVERFSAFLEALGARVLLLDARTHDRVAAAVSHLPQLTAVALMNVVGERHPDSRQRLRLAAGGFRDITRVASSNYAVWHDILRYNGKEIRRALKMLEDELKRYEVALRKPTSQRLQKSFNDARRLRNSIPKNMKGFVHLLAEIYVFVPDRPGMLATITVTLARANINIKDLELLKIREGSGGTFRLSFESQAMAKRASRLLQSAGFELSS